MFYHCIYYLLFISLYYQTLTSQMTFRIRSLCLGSSPCQLDDLARLSSNFHRPNFFFGKMIFYLLYFKDFFFFCGGGIRNSRWGCYKYVMRHDYVIKVKWIWYLYIIETEQEKAESSYDSKSGFSSWTGVSQTFAT